MWMFNICTWRKYHTPVWMLYVHEERLRHQSGCYMYMKRGSDTNLDGTRFKRQFGCYTYVWTEHGDVLTPI